MHPDLLVSQKNELFKIIEDNGLFPSDFTWKKEKRDYTSEPTPVLVHKSTDYYFLFRPPNVTDDYWHCKYSPAEDCPISSSLTDDGWYEVRYLFKNWVLFLKRELEVVDLWKSMEKIDLQTFKVSNSSNEPFNFNECKEISVKLKELALYTKSQAKDNSSLNDKLEIILQSIERLENQAKGGLGRIDWTNQLVGLVFNIIIAACLAPEQANTFFEYVRTLFSSGVKLLHNG